MKPVLLLITCFIALSCTKKTTPKYQASGIIKGVDLGACACCGGYILQIDGQDTSYRFFYFPAGSNVDSTHFPVNVNFDYVATGTCGINHFVNLKTLVKADQ